MTDLFDYTGPASDYEKPLAELMRPEKLEDILGQEHLLAKGAFLYESLKSGRLFSMILWGPPGCGKTSLARLMASLTEKLFVEISAVLSGVKELKVIIDEARQRRQKGGLGTLLFVDEIHRFNKAQQDAFLKCVEEGLITLIGATSENPSFELIPALLSRCRVFILNPIPEEDCIRLLQRALSDRKRGFGNLGFKVSDQDLSLIARMADGDLRTALSYLEMLVFYCLGPESMKEGRLIRREDIVKVLGERVLRHDKAGDFHYNLISAFHKSMRGSDPDAALYWLFRMLEAGEDPLYLIRRMVRFASEDIGVADPAALTMALSALEAYRFLGSPEGDGALAQAAVYLATAPKSNSVYLAQKAVLARIRETGTPPVPLHLRNAETRLMKELNYGREYKYPHDYKDAYVAQDYMPEALKEDLYYRPSGRAYEKLIADRMEFWRKKDKKS